MASLRLLQLVGSEAGSCRLLALGLYRGSDACAARCDDQGLHVFRSRHYVCAGAGTGPTSTLGQTQEPASKLTQVCRCHFRRRKYPGLSVSQSSPTQPVRHTSKAAAARRDANLPWVGCIALARLRRRIGCQRSYAQQDR
jgi:hypothetical protein